MATIYKTVSFSKRDNNTTRAISSEESTKVSEILTNFRTYFVAKHS